MNFKPNIRNKILVGIIPVTVFALVLTGIISYEKAAKTIKTEEIENMGQTTEMMVRTLDEWFESRLNFARTLSEDEIFRNACRGGELKQASSKLQAIFQEHGVYENVILMNTEGVIIAAAAEGAVGLNVREIPSYTINIDTANQGETHIGNAYASPVTGRPVSLITVPVRDGNQIVGILGTPIELNKFSEIFIDPIVFWNDGAISQLSIIMELRWPTRIKTTS